jgi:transcriptional regulator GlxA family with amidase domain
MLRQLAPNTIYRVGLLMLPGYSMMSLSSVITPLNTANRISGQTLYQWQTLTLTGEPVASSDGMLYSPDLSSDAMDDIDALIVCGGDSISPELFDFDADADSEINRQLLPWLLQRANRKNKKLELGALDSGSYLLARAGLLDGYSCTVHWEYMAAMREAFPLVETSSQLFVFDRNRFTCAGATATLDMMLYLICFHQGGELCAAISEHLMCERIRDEQDRQRVPLENYLGVSQPKLVETIVLMESNLEEPIATAELAQLLGVSRRHLERLFQKHLGVAPTRYYLQLRLQRAQKLLRQTDLSLMEIGIASGFSSTAYFNKCYRDSFGTPPGEERRSRQPSKLLEYPVYSELKLESAGRH